jgi:hypothetical protein
MKLFPRVSSSMLALEAPFLAKPPKKHPQKRARKIEIREPIQR